MHPDATDRRPRPVDATPVHGAGAATPQVSRLRAAWKQADEACAYLIAAVVLLIAADQPIRAFAATPAGADTLRGYVAAYILAATALTWAWPSIAVQIRTRKAGA